MTEFNYKKWNIILGWVSFAVALITYTLTLEPTVSSWDCGEYIATAVNLEVGHPPGAPLFQMLGAFFAMFTSDPNQLAKMVNFMSGLASAFTILFMFWTITNLARRMAIKNGKLGYNEAIAVLGSGLVGALAYTFSDSFWFSAVEGEVYAMSSFLMALLFWLGLRWESELNTPRGNKWLVLISFVVGLSFGVHILSLLVIPSIVLVYFFKTYKDINIKTTAIATLVAILVLAFVFKFLFPFTLKFFSVAELFFINQVGLPYNSGTIIAGIVLIALFFYGLKYTRKKNLVTANTLVLSVLFIMIGFSSWLMLPIRANADTIINENNPSSARELLAYYNREQYGDANVFYDNYYSVAYDREQDADNPYKDDKPKYEKIDGKYVIVNRYKNVLPNYSSKHKGFIPRMVNPASEQQYKSIAGIPARSKRRPTFLENIKFMVDFQFGYMYGRYFMWNFVGRQNDIQGHLDIENGNWLSGIDFIDEARLGSQQNLPDDIKNNKGRNTYFFLPFILGLIGLLYQLNRDKKNFYVLTLFFLFTGLAIIFYTNPKPFEPRERDYAVVGSFYVFAIWIGFGVLALYDYFKKYAPKKVVAIAVSVVSLLAVPALMGFQNWDDHDRADRYLAQLNAQTYLESCDPNAIIFTIGDNDTFPLWYMQQVEGVRRDIKIVNTSLFQTDWYIDQMKKKTYDADPIPSQLTHDQYKYGTLDMAYYYPLPQLKDSLLNIKDFMRWIASDNDATYLDAGDGAKEKFYPTNRIRIPVNKENALKTGLVAQKDADKMVDYIDITVDDRGLSKARLLMLDILNNFDWKRPIYFTGGANADEEYIWLKDYLQLDGMAYKLVPIKTSNKGRTIFDMGRIDPEKMYNNVKKWDWKTINNGEIYLDEQSKRNAISLRNNLIRLSEEFLQKGDSVNAKDVLDLSLHKMPIKDFDHYNFSLGYPELYYRIGDINKARETAETLADIFQQKLKYYSTFNTQDIDLIIDNLETTLYMYQNLVQQITRYDKDEDYNKKFFEDYITHARLFSHLMPEEEPELPQELDTIKP
ncbi:membrane protein [Tenacibaculum sp. KUL113]|nr:membrane protein [Tenacibaculum sp. KUL113]|eukprot:TRINITY_DN2027_c0_g2_i1.p1 TRINITY_DN2027_c0_g2~~TRINITY_DN2027_c0_g2_i1.p1  ORF type:complete len:1038 (+),score=168.08 TRINITY_DN2027_c0_g2_i1:110-3223(+)